MIKNFKPRLYQETILSTASLKNTLVVLPTGMGKTNIFLMLASKRLSQYPNSKILLVGPTKPLIDQYFSAFLKFFNVCESDMAIFTGEISPKKRSKIWEKSKIIFSTPQSIENDLIAKRISLENVSLLGIDEAHRAVGNYAYVWVSKYYNQTAKFPRVIGLTASPGSEIDKVMDVCNNLFIEDIEVRTEKDSDVAPYIQKTEINWVEVDLSPELKRIKTFFDSAINLRVNRLRSWGVIKNNNSFISKGSLLGLQSGLHKEAVIQKNNFTLWQSISIVAEVIKLHHASELLETQGISSLSSYMRKLRSMSASTKVKAVKNLVADINFKSAFLLVERLLEYKVEHPKFEKLKEIVKKKNGSKMIIFNQYRDSASKIVQELNKLGGVKAELFVGQLKKGNTGLSQKEQKTVLDSFREDNFNILVATSIAEEGLDIPKVDLVIFYEPIPSAIRYIQRKGRTGRQDKGEVIVLIAKDTRDVAFRWSAHHKQKKMYDVLDQLKNKISSPLHNNDNNIKLNNENSDSQNTLKDFSKILIFADHREKGSKTIKSLISKGIDLKLEQLKVGDYLCSQDVAVEFKTVRDFVDSLIDGRLLEQAKSLKDTYPKPIIILEGTEDIFSVRRIHPNAIMGLFATISVDFRIPIIRTSSPEESADLLFSIAKREQGKNKGVFSPHTDKRSLSLKDHQELIVSSLPGIGPLLAKPILKKFKNIKNVFNAKVNDLKSIPKIGKIKADRILEVIEKDYLDKE